MDSIDTYVTTIGRNLRHLPKQQRITIQREIHAHLREDVAARVKDGTTPEDASAAAISAFGDAEDIGLSYGGDVVNKTTGQTVLSIAAATGRAAGKGAKGALKWTGIVAASLVGLTLILLMFGLIFAGTAFTVFQDDIREATPRPVHVYSESWTGGASNTDTKSVSFQIGDEVKEFKVVASVDQSNGCAPIRLTAPDGTVHEINGNGCSDSNFVSTYVEKGTWTLEYTFVVFSGSVDVGVFSFEHA